MFRFEDGTLKKGAYVVIDGVEYEVHMPEYEGKTPLSSENLNRAVNELNSAIADVSSKKATMHITTDSAKGATITLPFNYFNGNLNGDDGLDIYLNGERLIESSDEAGTDGHYVRLGEAKSISNQIKITNDWNLENGDYLEFIVRGEWG